jgi:D-glycero-D-manno-heptose 1,7-bisphosphate phosphatase
VTERAVFLDRDGVINEIVWREGRPESPRNLREFILNKGIQEIVRKLKDHGFRIIVVSNQPDLARGKISQNTLDLMIQRIRQEIAVDDFHVCPHDDYHQCSCRKPKPGMLMKAGLQWNIDLSSSFIIGDTWKDMEAGKAAGCKTILLNTPYNRDIQCDFRVKSLKEAADLIIQNVIYDLNLCKQRVG